MKTFEDKLKRLEYITSTLERNEESIDEAIKLFEEGLKLSEELDKQLKGYELKIEELTVNMGDEKSDF